MVYSVGSQWTYTHHKKALQSIAFLESVRLVASTDGVLHVCLCLTELLPVFLQFALDSSCQDYATVTSLIGIQSIISCHHLQIQM